MADASLSEARSGVFHGWWIVVVSFFAQFLALGCSVATYGLFIPVLIDEFGASFMTANLGLSILFHLQLPSLPLRSSDPSRQCPNPHHPGVAGAAPLPFPWPPSRVWRVYRPPAGRRALPV